MSGFAIPDNVIEAAMKAEHEAERAALIAEGEEAPEPWDDIQDEWGDGTESWSREQALSFKRASLEAALAEWGATVDDEAVAAMQVILCANSVSGYLSGPKGIAEAAIDQAMPFLYKRGRLTETEVVALIRSGNLGSRALAALRTDAKHEHVSPDGGASPCSRCDQPRNDSIHERQARA